MRHLGQTSIEYLTTYGWMIVAVSLASTALYPTLNSGCKVQISGDIRTGGLAVEQVGADSNGTLKVVFDSNTKQPLKIKSIEMQGDDDGLTVVQPKELRPGADMVYNVGDVERTNGCETFETEIIFDKGPLKGQKKQLTISAPYELVERFLSLIRTRGDSIDQLRIDASVKPANDSMCIGLGCEITEGDNATEPTKYLNYSGDKMRGTLRTNKIDSICYGKNCTETKSSLKGYVNSNESFMAGTLRITELMPKDDAEKRLLIE